jgi:hypothetical protein
MASHMDSDAPVSHHGDDRVASRSGRSPGRRVTAAAVSVTQLLFVPTLGAAGCGGSCDTLG